MKKLNNKGFAISTILFSVLVIFLVVLLTYYSTLLFNSAQNPSKKCPNNCNNPNCICPKGYEDKDRCTGEFMIGEEHFCVLYEDADTVSNGYVIALAKYNLSKYGSNIAKQSNDASDQVSISTDSELTGNTYSFYDMINIPSKVSLFNTSNLTSVDTVYNNISKNIKDYISYYRIQLVNQKPTDIGDITIRLLNIDDLMYEKNFDCVDKNGKKIQNYKSNNIKLDTIFQCTTTTNNEWLFSSNYWTGVSNVEIDDDNNKKIALFTISNGKTIDKKTLNDSTRENGVRPVIEITKSDYKKLPKF